MTKRIFYFTVDIRILYVIMVLIVMINTFMIGIYGVHKENQLLFVMTVTAIQIGIIGLILMITTSDISLKVQLISSLCFLIMDSGFITLSILYFHLKERISSLDEITVNNI
jgi:hypothetical protein